MSQSRYLRLPSFFSDGVILRQGTAVKIWGFSLPRKAITCTFMQTTLTTIVKDDGRFEFILPPTEAGGPYKISFHIDADLAVDHAVDITVKDVYFGEVWLAMGQSNMELPIHYVMDKVLTQLPHFRSFQDSMIRFFKVPAVMDVDKAHYDVANACWEKAEFPALNSFSATAFFFAMSLRKKLKVPIGIINSSMDGAILESFMDKESLKAFPNSYRTIRSFPGTSVMLQKKNSCEDAITRWASNLKDSVPATYSGNCTVPCEFNDFIDPSFCGTIWFSKKFRLNEMQANEYDRLELGTIVDMDIAYLNGVEVGRTEHQYLLRKYVIPHGLLHEGENTLTIRVRINHGNGRFTSDKNYRLYHNGKYDDTSAFDLRGQFNYEIGTRATQEAPAQYFPEWEPFGLYNTMVAPLLGYTTAGMIWYQGESNASVNPEEYDKLFAVFVDFMRRNFTENMPILCVGLPNYGKEYAYTSPLSFNGDFMRLRYAQIRALSIPNVDMITTTDIGEWNDLHPVNKLEVGKRLALLAMRQAYHKSLRVFRSPRITNCSLVKQENRLQTVILSFDNLDGALCTSDGQPVRTVILGLSEEGLINGDAEIKGNNLCIHVPAGTEVRKIMYSCADNPASANLINKSGLPVEPFCIVL